MGNPGDETARRKRVSRILSIVFLVAIVMGPGPGIYLINPDPADPEAVRTLANIPVLYLWALFWFAVQAVVVILAYCKLWDERTAGEKP